MNFNPYINELRKKHSNLSIQIEDEQKRPSPDSLFLKGLKKKKLLIKEEIHKVFRSDKFEM